VAPRATNCRVSVWRRPDSSASSTTDYGEPVNSFAGVAGLADVPMDIQLGNGAVEQYPFGRMPSGVGQAYAASGVTIRADDGLYVHTSDVAAMVGRRFLVKRPMDWGARGGVQAELEDTQDKFGPT
jgi:hypothetical protein